MESIWSIKFRSKNKKELVKLIFNEHLDIGCSGPVQAPDGFFEVVAYVNEEKKKELVSTKSASMKVMVLEDMMKTGIERQKEVSKGNKLKDSGARTVKGLGIKE